MSMFQRWLCAFCLASVAQVRAQELHILSSIGEEVSVLWLPGGENDQSDGRFSGTVAASAGPPSVFSIDTYRGHAFRFQTGKLRSRPVRHSGGKHDLVLLSKKSANNLEVEVLDSTALQLLVRDMHGACESQAYTLCCRKYAASQRGIPAHFTDKYLEAYSPRRLAPRVLSRSPGSADPPQLDQEEGGFGYGVAPPDEFIILNQAKNKIDVYWVPFPTLDSTAATYPADQGTRVSEVSVGEVLALQAQPGQVFFVQGSGSSRTLSPSFKYPGELSVAVVLQDEAQKDVTTKVVDQDALKVALSDIASKCGDVSKAGMAPSFRTCLEEHAVFPGDGHTAPMPRALTFFWFLVLWTSIEHWRQCVYLPDSKPLREVKMELGGGVASANRTAEAQVLREEPLVLAIPGLATEAECDELIRSQDLLDLGGLDMAYVSGAVHSKSRRTLTRNLEVEEDERGILRILRQRFFEAARAAAGYELWPPGQEPVNWLHYIPGYEYRPHCDGGCGFQVVPSGLRVASSLLYCNVADEGGSTIFPKDATKFTPRRGDFLFFAYKSDPTELSLHAACPVLRGMKSTATQWYREGVREDWTWEDINDLNYPRQSTETLEL